MQKTYTVIEIYEADFGCEERPEGQETMVGIRLKAEKKMEKKLIGRKRMLNYMPRISMKAIKLFLLKEELKSNVDLFVDY